MIKKLNAILIVAVLLMLLFKVAADKLGQSGSGESAAAAAPVQARNVEFVPNLYYTPIVPYATINQMTARHGYILDVMRAIFPKSKFKPGKLSVAQVRDVLKKDPDAIVIYPDRLELRDMTYAPTPVTESDIVLYTLRSLEWSYHGIDSLKEIRLGFVEGYTVCSNLVAAFEASKTTKTPARVFRPDEEYGVVPRKAVEDNVVDAVALPKIGFTSATLGVTAALLVKYNVSPPIDRVPVYIFVANADAARAKQVVEAYEKGLKDIEASGELKRIREYYGLLPQAK